MGMFDLFKKKKSSDTEEVPSVSEREAEHQTESSGDVSISWDTLSFGVSGGSERGDVPYIPQERTVTKGSSGYRYSDTNVHKKKESESVAQPQSVPFVPHSRPSTAANNQTPSTISSPPATISRANGGSQISNRREKANDSIPKISLDFSKYVVPNSDLLPVSKSEEHIEESTYKEKLESVFQNYRVKAQIMTVTQTDVAVTFGIQPNPGVRVNSILGYKEEYALALGGRIEYEIPLKGTSYLGLHVLKENKSGLNFRSMIETSEYKDSNARIPMLMGVSTSGKPIIEDLDSLGHLLIGGETGSGKSVFLNSLILGMLYKRSPEELRFILIDTNVLNLNVYNSIPSLLIPVITDTTKAIAALSWCSLEIKKRTDIMIEHGRKDIDDYNNDDIAEKIPHIVVIIDEFAPLIETEDGLNTLLSLTTMGKPMGVHMILSTQKISSRNALRKIKECIHARVAFSLFSESESRALLDLNGAEKLSGSGDMVYRKPGQNELIRIQGINVTDTDTVKTIDSIKASNSQMINDVIEYTKRLSAEESYLEYDELLRQAGIFVIERQKASIGMLQRLFKIGFNRAARIMDQLGELGVVGPEEGTRPRDILMDTDQFADLMNSLNI